MCEVIYETGRKPKPHRQLPVLATDAPTDKDKPLVRGRSREHFPIADGRAAYPASFSPGRDEHLRDKSAPSASNRASSAPPRTRKPPSELISSVGTSGSERGFGEALSAFWPSREVCRTMSSAETESSPLDCVTESETVCLSSSEGGRGVAGPSPHDPRSLSPGPRELGMPLASPPPLFADPSNLNTGHPMITITPAEDDLLGDDVELTLVEDLDEELLATPCRSFFSSPSPSSSASSHSFSFASFDDSDSDDDDKDHEEDKRHRSLNVTPPSAAADAPPRSVHARGYVRSPLNPWKHLPARSLPHLLLSFNSKLPAALQGSAYAKPAFVPDCPRDWRWCTCRAHRNVPLCKDVLVRNARAGRRERRLERSKSRVVPPVGDVAGSEDDTDG